MIRMKNLIKLPGRYSELIAKYIKAFKMKDCQNLYNVVRSGRAKNKDIKRKTKAIKASLINFLLGSQMSTAPTKIVLSMLALKSATKQL